MGVTQIGHKALDIIKVICYYTSVTIVIIMKSTIMNY